MQTQLGLSYLSHYLPDRRTAAHRTPLQLCVMRRSRYPASRVLRACPKRGLTLWRRFDFIGFFCSPERVRPLFGQVLSLAVAVIWLLLSIPVLAQAPAPPGYGGGGFNSSMANPTFTNQTNPNQPSARIASNAPFGATPQVPSSIAPSAAENLANANGLSAADSATDAETGSRIPMSNLLSVIRQGGVLMLPIIACSMVLFVFVSERLLFLRRSRVIPRHFIRGVIEQLEQQQLGRDEAIALCEENASPIAQLFTSALKKYGRSAVEVEQAVLDAGERVTSQLRKYLRLFNAISNLTPLLGLLGTVLGMIDAFNTIASADAMGRPELLASGIGTALITTAAGLVVAIPAYAAYAFFLGRTDKLILEMDAYAQNVVELISAEGLQESGKSRSRSRSRAA